MMTAESFHIKPKLCFVLSNPRAMSLAEPVPLTASLQRLQINSFFSFSAYTLLVYDYCLTFEAEVRLIWSAKWSLTKILFFLTRYPVFVNAAMVLYYLVGNDVTPKSCDIIYQVSAWSYLWGVAAAEAILILRTWAIWGRDKRVGICLTMLFLGLWIASSVFMSKFLKSLRVAPGSVIAPFLKGCVPIAGNNLLYLDFVLIMVFETIVVFLTLLKGIQTFRKQSSPLIMSLYRDGILFYLYLFALSIINVVVLLTAPPEYTNLLSALQRTLHSILSARLLLNLREASLRSTALFDGVAETSAGTRTHRSEILFKPGTELSDNIASTMFSIDHGDPVPGDDWESHSGWPSSNPCAVRGIELTTLRPNT